MLLLGRGQAADPTRFAIEPAAAEMFGPLGRFRLRSTSRARRPSRAASSRPTSDCSSRSAPAPAPRVRLAREPLPTRLAIAAAHRPTAAESFDTADHFARERPAAATPAARRCTRQRSPRLTATQIQFCQPDQDRRHGTAAIAHTPKNTPNGVPPSNNRGNFWRCSARAASRTAVVVRDALDRLIDGVRPVCWLRVGRRWPLRQRFPTALGRRRQRLQQSLCSPATADHSLAAASRFRATAQRPETRAIAGASA